MGDKCLKKVLTDPVEIDSALQYMLHRMKAEVKYVEDKYTMRWYISKPAMNYIMKNTYTGCVDYRTSQLYGIDVVVTNPFDGPYVIELKARGKWNTQYLSTNYRASSLFDKAIMDYFKRDEDMLNTLVPKFIKTNKEVSELINFDVANSIKEVIYNDPATIVFWNDGTKTVVKCGEDDTYNPETGLAMCIVKKITGNKGNYNNVFRKWVK